MIRRLFDALLVLFAVSNGYHVVVAICRYCLADKRPLNARG